MNLCFRNLGIMNRRYFGSGIMNNLNETLRRAQQNTRISGNARCTMHDARCGVSESPIFKIFFRANMLLDPPPPVTVCLMCSYKKPHAKTKRMMIPSLNEAEV